MAKITFEEAMEAFFPEGVPWHLVKRPKPAPPAPKAATAKAEERWSAQKPLSAVLQDAQRAEAAATERLRQEREEMVEVVGFTSDGKTEIRRKMTLADYQRALRQAEIDAAWQRNLDYQRELAQWPGCHRGPGDPDWRGSE